MRTAAVDLIQEAASGRVVEPVSRVVAEQLRESKDRVERCPQLVAHAGEELALRSIGLFRLPLRLSQCLLRQPCLSDVIRDAKQESRFPGHVQDRDFLRVQCSSSLELGLDGLLRDVDEMTTSQCLSVR